MKQKQWEQLREGLAGSVGEVMLYLTACALHDIVPIKCQDQMRKKYYIKMYN